MHLKKAFLLLLATSLTEVLFSQKFKIENIDYELDKTQQSAIERNIKISTEKIFDSQEELEKYIEDLHQKFENKRIFDEVTIKYDIQNNEYTENSIQLVNVHINTKDSKNLLILPYPKYSSSDGLELKLKIKHSNFLGTMSKLSSELFFATKNDEDDENIQNHAIGFNLNYDFPFTINPFEITWKNNYEFEYTLETKSPEFNLSTGFSVELPFDEYSLILEATQSAIRDLEYEDFNDELHFNTDVKLSMPITFAEIENWGDFKWTPYIDYSIFYDKDGINIENTDLTSPVLTFGHKVGTERINWIDNFRDGLSAEFGQSIGYDFQREEYRPKLYGEIKAFRALKYLGLATRLYAFTSFGTTEKIGKRIRGVLDKQRYANSKKRALKVSSAIVLNADIPIHIITTDWNYWTETIFGEESWISNHTKWFKTFDFELQLSPFIDVALTKNEITGNTFATKDGWYAGGIEVLVFPAKWKSIVVRGSCGFDLGKKFLNQKEDSWRKDVSDHEIYIGIGLNY